VDKMSKASKDAHSRLDSLKKSTADTDSHMKKGVANIDKLAGGTNVLLAKLAHLSMGATLTATNLKMAGKHTEKLGSAADRTDKVLGRMQQATDEAAVHTKRGSAAVDQMRDSAKGANVQLQALEDISHASVAQFDKLAAAIAQLTGRMHAGGASNSMNIQTLHVHATDPASLQRQLLQQSRRSAISSNPTGQNMGTMA